MLQEIQKTPKICIGLFFICIGLNWFLLPHDIASAGIGSIGHLLETAFSIDRTLSVWIGNIALLILAGICLEKPTFFKSIIGSLLYPIALRIVPLTTIFNSYILSLVIGSLLFSFGIYCLYYVDASNGGVTLPPLILNKHLKIPVAMGLMMTNVIIVFLNYITFGIKEAFIACIAIALTSLSMKLFIHIKPIPKP